MVRDGRIDTIVVAFTDMQGRLMGKRVHGQAFLDGVISHGAHFCTYLLGTDMEMNTPEGYRADELGDRLRRLDRRADLGPAPIPAVAAGDGARPRRHHRRGDRPGDPGLAADDPQAPGRRCRRTRGSRSRRARSSSSTSSRTRGSRSPSAAGPSRRPSATTTRTTTSSRRRRRSRSTTCCATR